MKKISQNTITIAQKKVFASYTETLINHVFSTKIIDKNQLLTHIIDYTKNESCSEAILKQSLLKGCFPRITWPKQTMLEKACISPKITVSHPKEVSDVRFLTEIHITDRLANTTSVIKTLVFNSENPLVAQVTSSSGNKFKDVTLNIQISQEELSLNADIKSGNNAYHIFKGIVANIPLKENYQPYGVFNSPCSLEKLQEQRLQVLARNVCQGDNFNFYDKHYSKIREISQLPIDPITINNLIQEELLNCVILKKLNQQPSLYTAHKISVMDFNEKYFERLEPYVSPRIFDNKEIFNKFMSKALYIYITTVEDISRNISNDFWKGTGFENIAHDIFK